MWSSFGKKIVELRTRINWDRIVYRARMFTSDVRMVVSCFLALKKRAAMPPKPQLVSRERTANGKASRFLLGEGATELSLCGSCGNLMVKGTRSFLLGKVSTGILSRRCPNVDTEKASDKKIKRQALIMYNV